MRIQAHVNYTFMINETVIQTKTKILNIKPLMLSITI